MPYAAARHLPDVRQGSTADATWVSLLTVRVIRSQVKLDSQHRDFHNVSTAGDLGCGKQGSRAAVRGGGYRAGVGKPHCSALHTLWMNLWTTSCGQ